MPPSSPSFAPTIRTAYSESRPFSAAAKVVYSGPSSKFFNLNCEVNFDSFTSYCDARFSASNVPRATAEIVVDSATEKGEGSGGRVLGFGLVYSNTPADFDFKLESLAQRFPSLSEFAEHLAASVDIVFPVIHGQFGEDGGIQELLEKYNIPFVGIGSSECRRAFDKYEASLELRKQEFVTVPNILVQGSEPKESEVGKWFTRNQLDTKSGKVVVKPVRAGSSIGVTVAYGVADALKKAKDIKLEVELHFNEDDAIFNYRRKYLPTRQLEVIPCLLAPSDGRSSNAGSQTVWSLPHNVEEVLDACTEATDPSRASLTSQLRKQVMGDLMEGLEKHRWFNGFDVTDEKPVKFSLQDWIKHAKEVQATVFLTACNAQFLVHGDFGEDGTLQSLRLLQAEGVPYTGHGILASKICMDKVATSLAVSHAHGPIEMPNPPPEKLIFEPFIEMDGIIVSSKSADGLLWEGESRWVEIKVGVVGKRGCMQSLCPSITVKEGGDILSLEEKFQGGTDINLTPPPPSIVSEEALEKCKQRIELVANTLELEGFSRIDAFLNVDSGEVPISKL
ncbi:unnamed protein product [Linum tenue]|uniref:D-alanine--D-alanine ligase N-terminal domain-containing protein n=1 Tax=Linum tenue TaxID=586396 RepID=A0AAV0PXG5_9ROSI|nr:unnamed protein product [Linum tenue]